MKLSAKGLPELNTLALLALAALAASFAGGALLKRPIGALVVLSAVYLGYLAIRGLAGVTTESAFAHGLCGLAGLLELAAAMILLLRPAGLPRMGAKYSRAKEKTPTDPDQRMWQALSEGEDPTQR